VSSYDLFHINITPAQCRAARALLDWTEDDLAAHSKVSKRTILYFEKDTERQPLRISLDALQQAFEVAGIEFTNGNEPGVKLKQRKS
jgi:transcriptional regulator with XRE-family HTH domain